jgi:murein DD-endopeptidase MepM/ murein hydrolase activator NlpD
MRKIFVLFFMVIMFYAYGEQVSAQEVIKMTVAIPPNMFCSPVDDFIVTSYLGDRQDVFGGGELDYHKGVDLVSAKKDAPIKAAADGVVLDHYLPPGTVRNGTTYKGHPTFGGLIVIGHAGGITTLYAHMKKTLVHIGQTVKKGEVIGTMGDTGKATGVHLHFEVHGTIYGKYALENRDGPVSVQKLEILLDPMLFILPDPVCITR